MDLVLLPRAHDLDGFEVRRALPARGRQMIGPFIFFGQMGPGEILHRDSLGLHPPIIPGDVNW